MANAAKYQRWGWFAQMDRNKRNQQQCIIYADKNFYMLELKDSSSGDGSIFL